MNPQSSLPVTVFTDYICPFCYIGFLRLHRLTEDYQLAVDWRFLEIHPDNPPEGRSVSELGYPPEQWARMMTNLSSMAAEEGVRLAERRFTTNSHQALLLAEAVKCHLPDEFRQLNRRMFEAYFLEQKNIGNPEVLRALADEAAVPARLVDQAWRDSRYAESLRRNLRDAARLNILGTPTFLINDRIAAGAVPVSVLRQMANAATPDAS